MNAPGKRNVEIDKTFVAAVAKTRNIHLGHGKAYLGLAFAVFCWAANTVLARGVANDIMPMALAFWRWVFAFAIILPFSFSHVRREKHEIGRNLYPLLVLSFFSVAVYNSLLYIAAQFTTATNMSIAVASMPAITLLVARAVLKEVPTWAQTGGVIISGTGMLIIIFKGSAVNLFSLNFNYGDLLVVCSILSWSFYSVFIRKFKLALHPLTFLTMTILIGSLVIAPFYCWEIFISGQHGLLLRNLHIFLFLAIFPSIIAYLFWNNGVLSVGPSKAAMFFYLLPIFGAVLALGLLGEKFFVYHLVGSLFIFVGLYLAIKQRGIKLISN